MVWLGVQIGKKKCPKVFEEISSFVEEISSFVKKNIVVPWRNIVVRCSLMTAVHFVSQEGNTKICWRKRKKDFYDVLLNKLISSVKNQKDFWESVHKISPKRKSVCDNISLYSWFQHFRALLEKEVDFDFEDENAIQDNESSLNRPISKEEVLLAFRKLNNNLKKDSSTGQNNRIWKTQELM